MAHPETLEHKLLSQADSLIVEAIANYEDKAAARLSLLESVACIRAGIREGDYRAITGYVSYTKSSAELINDLIHAIDASGIPFALAMAALARVPSGEIVTKRNGSVYTDYRLALYLAEAAMDNYRSGTVIDVSCGTSIVLAACAEYEKAKVGDASKFVSEHVFGIDLSPSAIRGSLLTLTTYLNNSEDLTKLASHFFCANSLELANQLPRHFGITAFDVIVGNPPWERVRPSRNEYARERGVTVTYGSEIETLPEGYERHREQSKDKALQLSKTYRLKGGADLYRAFLSLSKLICAPDGVIALYLPAGVIRSKSLADTRGSMLQDFRSIEFSIFTNQPRFFAIDSRFKFVLTVLRGKIQNGNTDAVMFHYCTADEDSVLIASSLKVGSEYFCDSSRELGSPEVKNKEEYQVLKKVWLNGTRMSAHPLFSDVHPMRELDMTLDKSRFKKANEISKEEAVFPLIEGRMVSQYRCGCKEYVSGSGRSAKWIAVPMGSSRISPQFYVPEHMLNSSLLSRTNMRRIGFCDIAGQTNERAMQAAFIPAGCVCGNKVPTMQFGNDDAAMLWLGIVNSLVFDWIVRRYITTTINFFIIENLPFPDITSKNEIAQEIIRCVKEIVEFEDGDDGWNSSDLWLYAQKRAEIDRLSFSAYGLNQTDFDTIVSDFPLIDQVNDRICPGIRPTIELAKAFICEDISSYDRAKRAWSEGAMPYVPNEHIRSSRKQGL